MYPLAFFSVNSQVVVLHPNQLVKLSGSINAGASATVYVQVFDSRTLPANTTIPLLSKEIVIANGLNFEYNFNRDEFPFAKGLVVAVSTTAGTLTVGTLNNKFDILNVELYNQDLPSGTSYVGDETTALNTKQIWSEATGAAAVKKLYRLIISELLGTKRYVFGFADDAKTIPIFGPLLLAANAVGTVYDFGQSGFTPFAQTSAYVAKRGLTIVVADSPTDSTSVTANSATIEAEVA